MQEEESPIICVGSLIICCNTNVEVIPSILEPSYVVLLPLNHGFDLTLKSPRTAVKKVLWAVAVSIFNSKLFANDSKSSCDWLGERYKDTNLHNLPPILISKLMHHVNIEYLEFLREQSFYSKYKHRLV